MDCEGRVPDEDQTPAGAEHRPGYTQDAPHAAPAVDGAHPDGHPEGRQAGSSPVLQLRTRTDGEGGDAEPSVDSDFASGVERAPDMSSGASAITVPSHPRRTHRVRAHGSHTVPSLTEHPCHVPTDRVALCGLQVKASCYDQSEMSERPVTAPQPPSSRRVRFAAAWGEGLATPKDPGDWWLEPSLKAPAADPMLPGPSMWEEHGSHSARTLHAIHALFSPPGLTQCPHAPLHSCTLLTVACALCGLQVGELRPTL
jgi:hypothetical protein